MHFVILPWVFSIIIELPSLYSQPEPGGSNLFLGRYPIPANTSDPININTKKAHKVFLPPLTISADGSTPMRLENTGSVVQGVPLCNNPANYVSGGPVGNIKYRFLSERVYWTDDPNGREGTSIDCRGAPLGYRASFINNKYTYEEAIKKRDGMLSLVFLAEICPDDAPSKNFVPLYNALRQIQQPKTNTSISLGDIIKTKEHVTPNSVYWTYPGPYVDPDGNVYFCSTIMVFPFNVGSCLSSQQLLNSVGQLKNSTGGSLTYQHAQYPATMPIAQAKYVRQIGISQ